MMLIESSLILAGQMGLAILAGLLLNLTPCVLPAIPIKVRTILRESGSQRSHRTLAATAFVAGTLSLFLGLGALTALLQWNWGTLFQSTGFVAVLVVVLSGFAFMTWRDISIPVPQFAALAQGRRYLEAYISGLLSAVLAAPCAGPFLGGVLAFAVTQPPHIIMMLFTGIGIGLALPYMLLMFNPHWLARLPRAGAWTRAVREVLAFILLAAAVFFSTSLLPKEVVMILWWLWLGLVILWAGIRSYQGTRGVRGVTGTFSLLALLLPLSLAVPRGAGNHGEGIQWQSYSADLIAEVRRENRPHLLEFTADWCINCKVLESSVYGSPAVAAAVLEGGVVPIQVDLTRSVLEQDQLLVETGGQALPFAAVIDGNGEAVASFTGLFEEKSLIQALRTAAD
ncbi:protein-disulfide reductase DsbD family protein [Marinobacter sp.]|uniref:protein-disulfide reductase DsbD family protein n=1 Tax=Marinobacter sp. TaxID=50741 RepID=UPI00384CD442